MDTYLLVALLIVAVGVALLVGEFIVPTGGFLLVFGVLLFAVATGVIWYYGSAMLATIALVGFCIGTPAVGWLAVQGWKKLAINRSRDSDTAGGTITQAMPELSEMQALVGAVGSTLTLMRPSGSVELNGRRLDGITEGMMLEPGTPVRCVAVRSGCAVVRKIDKTNVQNDFDLKDFA